MRVLFRSGITVRGVRGKCFPAVCTMAKNSSRKNAFTYFVEEYTAEQIALGRKITKQMALHECTMGWSELEPEERLRYCNMANPMLNRSCKSRGKAPVPENMEWLDPVTGEYGEKWFRYVRAGDELNYLKSSLTSEKKLKRFSFYLVHCNYFCQPSLKKYVPAELALLEFNLAEGIKNVYHTLINPGSIPLGYAHEAKKLSQEGHGIPIPPQTKGERDMGKIIDAVKKFLQYGTGPTGKFPPLFTLVENVLPAMHILNDMVPYNEDQPVFTVYPSQRMFYWIKNKCIEISGKGEEFMDESLALKEIERDCFRYILEIACDFHKQSDISFPMCSQSIVKRLAFTICDHCCLDLNITLVGGRHMHKSVKNSSPKKGEEKLEKAKKPEERSDETEEEISLESAMAKYCVCGEKELPDFIGGFSTKEPPQTGLERLSSEEMDLYYEAFMHNLIHGNVKIDLEEEMRRRDLEFLRTTEYDLCDNPSGARLGTGPDDPLPTVAEQLAAYRYQENRKIRHMVLARVKAREAREAREAFERKTTGVMEAKANGKEVKSVNEHDK